MMFLRWLFDPERHVYVRLSPQIFTYSIRVTPSFSGPSPYWPWQRMHFGNP